MPVGTDGGYDMPQIIRAVGAWEKRKEGWLQQVKKSGQKPPETEQVENYRNIWLEGYLQSTADSDSTT